MYGVCGGCLWCGAVGSSGTRAQCGAQASPRQLQEVQDCQGQLQISQAGVKCLCCFFPPLLFLPALPKINNCVNSGVIVLGQQPPRLPGLGRCWQGLLEPHAGSRLGLAARREGGHRQAGGRTGVSGALQTQRTSCLLLSGPREQPPSSLSQAQSETSGQVSQGVLGVSEGQVLTSRFPLPLVLERGKTSPDWGARAGGSRGP